MGQIRAKSHEATAALLVPGDDLFLLYTSSVRVFLNCCAIAFFVKMYNLFSFMLLITHDLFNKIFDLYN